MTRPVAFRQADITRAIHGAEAAGKTVSGIEVDGGRIVLHFEGAETNDNARRTLDRCHAA